MTKILSADRSLLGSVMLFSLIGGSPVTGYSRVDSGKFQTPPAAQSSSNLKIPEAPQSCETEECKWWEELRALANDANQAQTHKDQTLAEAYAKAHREGRRPKRDTDVLPKNVVDRLYGDVERSSANYLKLLREGQEKEYRIPAADSSPLRPVVVRRRKALYTEEARSRKIQGTVLLSVTFQADGTIGGIKVVRGLEEGLTESAIEAAKYVLVLPAVKDSKFVSTRGNIEFSFSLY